MRQPDHQLYTYTYLYKITDTSPSFIHKMIGLFVSSLDEYITELEAVLKSKNLPELKRLLHKMKPSVINLEVKGAGEILKLVSSSATWNDATQQSVQQLIEILRRIRPLMQKDLIDLSGENS